MPAMPADPFAAKRAAMRDEFFSKQFLLGGWPGATDTYKRTMWAAVPVIADASESDLGEPLFVKLVENGRVIYRESFDDQAARADRTWGRYSRWELSPTIAGYMQRFGEMRKREVEAARHRMG